jgi:hypothetical protein
MPNAHRRHWSRRRLALETLESRSMPALLLAAGAGEGGSPQVKIFDEHGLFATTFFAYDPALRGGVHVATGDVTGDGIDDVVTAPGPGGGPHVRVFDGFALMGGRVLEVLNFMAYDTSFRGGVNIAVADVTGNGRADIITGAGIGGGPHVRVFDGMTGEDVHNYMAYERTFRGGVSVAAGKVLGGNKADIVTAPGPGGGPHFKVISGAGGHVVRDWIGFDIQQRPKGYSLATAYVNEDAAADIMISPGVGGGPMIKVFDGSTGEILREMAAGDGKSRGGSTVAAADTNGDGLSEIVVSNGPGLAAEATMMDGRTGATINTVPIFDPNFRGGASVAVIVPIELAGAVSRSFDFRQGDLGWVAGFANVPAGLSPQEWQLDAGLRALPPELGAGNGFMMQGENRSAELMMYLKKNIGPSDGIQPGRVYRVRFTVDLGSNMSGEVGLGGSVDLLAGVSAVEPRVLPAADGTLRLTTKTDKAAIGAETTVLGDTFTGQPVGPGEPPYVALSRSGTVEVTARADESGNLWLLVGTRSGFEGFTRLFYRRITATLLPLAE